jgi:hypothetical protein
MTTTIPTLRLQNRHTVKCSSSGGREAAIKCHIEDEEGVVTAGTLSASRHSVAWLSCTVYRGCGICSLISRRAPCRGES